MLNLASAGDIRKGYITPPLRLFPQAPRDVAGEFTGLMAFIANVGGSLGPIIMGAIAEATSLRVASTMSGGVAVAGIAFWAFVLPETLQRPAGGGAPAKKRAAAEAATTTRLG